MGIERHNVIFAGVGGMGALTSGQLLAKAAMKKFKNVTWYPNITTARRNAPADCLVCYSDTMIYSQLIKDVETAVVMNNIQFDTMKNRVKSGGLLILEADDYAENIERKDIQVIKVPGIKISSKIANPRVINTVYLGVYIGATKTVPHELVKTELEKRFEGKNEILKMNLEAFKEGVNFGEAA
jgi:2-oxoglutarate ferredoxin oxidoreductase subunit gamma